jgi:hypothetical protein
VKLISKKVAPLQQKVTLQSQKGKPVSLFVVLVLVKAKPDSKQLENEADFKPKKRVYGLHKLFFFWELKCYFTILAFLPCPLNRLAILSTIVFALASVLEAIFKKP